MKYSVAVPVFNAEKTLDELIRRIEKVFIDLKCDFEVILVNDGSSDRSWEVLQSIRSGSDNVKIIDFVRNFGQHNALLCAFRKAAGDFIITLDDDLQNPPEEIPKLIETMNSDESLDMVIGKFKVKRHSFTRRLGSRIIGWLNTKIFHKPRGLVLTNFRLIRSSVIQEVSKTHLIRPYIPGLILLSCGKCANVEVEHRERSAGKSNYTLGRITDLVMRLLFGHSSFLIRILSLIGIIMSLISFIIALVYIVTKIIQGFQVPGFATLVVMISFFSACLLMLLAALGEFIAQSLESTSGRAAYLIRREQ